MERKNSMVVKEVSRDEMERIIQHGEPAGLFMCLQEKECLGVDNRTGEAFFMAFETEDECVS